MSRLGIPAVLAALAVVLALATASCGGGSSEETVASFGGEKLTRAELAVRERFEAVAAGRQVPLRKRARSKLPVVIPYQAAPGECAAAVRRVIAPGAAAELTAAKLRDYCKSTASRIRETALNGLLATHVNAAEAAERGIVISDADVDAELRKLHATFGGPGNVAAYTSRTGLTEDDLRERAYQTARAERLRAAVLRERSAVTEADMRREYAENLDRYKSKGRSYDAVKPLIRKALEVTKPQTAWTQWQAEVTREWRPKIECHDGYVLANLCGNRAATALPIP